MLRDKLLAPTISAEPIITIDGNAIHARKLSGLDVAEIQAALPEEGATTGDMIRFSAKLVVLGACDASGNRVFNDDDADAVSKMPYDMLKILVVGVKKHNGMDDEVKNSSTPSTASS